ncbi:hypothetical protein MUK42_13845 [Musa troglodytarum]|uniref:Uncharacterized protein n=1 Tax=Musa troglodytarum TaxID=320322 RepID=A0A9E7H5Q2_9LILI|nr:hypothetical protein MUK42_13845 [Musa troglodytarum]
MGVLLGLHLSATFCGVLGEEEKKPELLQPLFSHSRHGSKLSTVTSIASPIRRSTSTIGLLHLLCVRPLLPDPNRSLLANAGSSRLRSSQTEEYDEHKGDCDEYEEDAYGEDEQETPRPTKEE